MTLGNRISWRMTLIMQEILIRLCCRSSCILFCFKCMLYGYCINATVLYEIFSELYNAFSHWIKTGCVCVCSLLQSDQLWSYVMARTSSILMRWKLFPLYSKPADFVRLYIVLAHWNSSLHVYMAIHLYFLSWFPVLLRLLNCMLNLEAANTNCTCISLIGPVFNTYSGIKVGCQHITSHFSA